MKTFILLFVLIVAGCSPQMVVYTDQDPQTDVRLFSKFRWLEVGNIEAGHDPIYYNQLNDKRIKSAVAAQLNLAGYTLDKDNAELIVHYHIVVREKGVVYTEDFGYCYGKYWSDEKVHLQQYSEGTIIIDIMDAKSNDLMWRGWAVSALDDEDPSGIREVIQTSIEKMFIEFPHSFNLGAGNQNL